MKRKIYTIIISLLLLAIITTTTVLAKTVRTDWVEQKMRKGHSETDTYSIMAVLVLSEENVSSFIEQKYDELGDWDKVAEYYKIDVDEFNNFVAEQIELAEELEIPDKLYDEMIANGMTNEECRQLAISANNAEFDINTVWEAKKNGKTVNDLIKERTQLKTQKSQTATDYTFGLITEKEYMEKMRSLSPDMSISEIIKFAAEDRKAWRELRIKGSGISQQEIALAMRNGIMDIFEMCRLKDAEKYSNKSFDEMVLQVKKGDAVDTVIEANKSTEKFEAAKRAELLE